MAGAEKEGHRVDARSRNSIFEVSIDDWRLRLSDQLKQSPFNRMHIAPRSTGLVPRIPFECQRRSRESSVARRWVDSFPWLSGIYMGQVPSYCVVDLNASYRG